MQVVIFYELYEGKAHLCKITVINVILLFIDGKKFVNLLVNSKTNWRICNYLLFKSGKAAITLLLCYTLTSSLNSSLDTRSF